MTVPPKGWKLVPVEPTQEMIDAGRMARMNIQGGYGGIGGWEAMLAAAPQAPTAPSPETIVSGEPDYCYDPSEWEFTCNWDDRDQVHGWGDALEPGEPMRVATLFAGPDKWVADVPITWDTDGNPDDRETKWFDSEAEARAALSATATEAKP